MYTVQISWWWFLKMQQWHNIPITMLTQHVTRIATAFACLDNGIQCCPHQFLKDDDCSVDNWAFPTLLGRESHNVIVGRFLWMACCRFFCFQVGQVIFILEIM
jgi:hypothetical protein